MRSLESSDPQKAEEWWPGAGEVGPGGAQWLQSFGWGGRGVLRWAGWGHAAEQLSMH